MKYNEYSYLYPPRPDKAIPRDFLSFYERQGFIGQVKKNGTCNVLAVSPKKEIICMNRHAEPHKAWVPGDSVIPFRKLSGKGWYVFVTEVLHSKVPGIRDTQYVFDILVHDGTYLIGSTLEERLNLLQKIFLRGKEEETYSHYIITPNVWLAKTITGGFKDLFDSLNNPEDEGLVLKRPGAKLQMCSKPKANANWQVKCRKQHKNYTF